MSCRRGPAGGWSNRSDGLRHWVLVLGLIVSMALAGQPPAPAATAAAPASEEELSAAQDAAVARGLAFLARQQADDGSFGSGPKLALTGLTLMSFLACGHTPDRGRYGLVARNAVDHLLNHAPDDGYFGKVDGSRMYGQGIVTLALAEAYGVESDVARRTKLRAVLQKSMKVILTAQTVSKPQQFAGGWRYEPQSVDSDLSLSGWCALALRACQNVGLEVPKEPIGRALGFVMNCYRADQRGFAYQPGGEATASMSGVALLNLYLLDAADRPEIGAAARFLVEKPVAIDQRFAYYAFYYVTQAAYQAGEQTWNAVWPLTRQRLLAEQQADGGWSQSRTGEEPGRIYTTSMALLALSVPYRLLPTYQR